MLLYCMQESHQCRPNACSLVGDNTRCLPWCALRWEWYPLNVGTCERQEEGQTGQSKQVFGQASRSSCRGQCARDEEREREDEDEDEDDDEEEEEDDEDEGEEKDEEDDDEDDDEDEGEEKDEEDDDEDDDEDEKKEVVDLPNLLLPCVRLTSSSSASPSSSSSSAYSSSSSSSSSAGCSAGS